MNKRHYVLNKQKKTDNNSYISLYRIFAIYKTKSSDLITE